MNGVIFEQDENSFATICIVEEFSDELKNLIRQNLSSICLGAAQGNSQREVYSYENTLREFINRLQAKNEDQKKGMIGELLAHILLISHFEDFSIISPFFNMEDRGMKKAFDVILFHSTEQRLYFTEVKAGGVNQENSDTNAKNLILLREAKRDILEKIQSNNDKNWLNAINGAKLALESMNIRDIVVSSLENCLSLSQTQESDAGNENVILVSAIYNNISDRLILRNVTDYSETVQTENNFNFSIIFSIQKQTYERVSDFLESEAQGA